MSRALTRLVTTSVASAMTLALTAGPALAEDLVGPLEGHDPAPPMSLAETVLLYVLVPLGSVLLLAALVLLPGAARRHRYRPAEGWAADPVWFAGPLDPKAAIAAADRGALTRGGAGGSW